MTLACARWAQERRWLGRIRSLAANGTYTMSVSSKLVIEAVNVKDKQGKSISGLTAKDFTVTEDGVAQKITFCEYQELPVARRLRLRSLLRRTSRFITGWR